MSKYKKCGYYSDGECNIFGMGISGEDTFCRLCKDNPNCYYKQLFELKTENERLKENYIKLSQQKDLDNARWVKRCTDLHIEDKAIADKYWLTLQEIKAISEECTTCGDCSNCKYCEDCDTDLECQALGVCKMILDIITKAEEE